MIYKKANIYQLNKKAILSKNMVLIYKKLDIRANI